MRAKRGGAVDASIQNLDGHYCSVLVHVGKHRPSDTKPEKLVAKAILASSNPGDLVLDPFLGSGTTSVFAKKLGRRYVGIECDETYCCLAEKRLALADQDRSIQGYSEGVFWERNSLQGVRDTSRKFGVPTLFAEDNDE